jgi:hypothetical protein
MKMRRDSAIPSLIVVAFLLAPFAFFGGPAGAATITTFGNGSSDATLTFPTEFR